MTVARDIITGAYRRLGLLPLGADLDPERTAAGLSAYNDMLNAWAADGIFPGGPYPPIQQADGFNASGDFIDGSIALTGGAYPPFGPSDTSTPPSGSELSYGLDDAFPFLPQFIAGAKAMLAVELARRAESNRSPRSRNAPRKPTRRCWPIM